MGKTAEVAGKASEEAGRARYSGEILMGGKWILTKRRHKGPPRQQKRRGAVEIGK